MANFVAYAIVSATVSGILSSVLAPDPDTPFVDSKPQALAERGHPAPVLIGRKRIGSLFAWAGKRWSEVRTENGYAARYYYQDAWHILSVGVGHTLKAIYYGGKQIWKGPITRETHPSGTTVNVGNDEGTFTVYWGEDDQPLNATLAGYRPSVTPNPEFADFPSGGHSAPQGWLFRYDGVTVPGAGAYWMHGNPVEAEFLDGEDTNVIVMQGSSGVSAPEYIRLETSQKCLQIGTEYTIEYSLLGNSTICGIKNGSGSGCESVTPNGIIYWSQNGTTWTALPALTPGDHSFTFTATGEKIYLQIDGGYPGTAANNACIIDKFRVYDPTNWVNGTTISSRWPGYCYIHWNDRSLGTSPQWNTTDYVLECRPVADWGTPLSDLDPHIQSRDGDGAYDSDGINPASALDQLIFAPWPHGAGRDASLYDTDSLRDIYFLLGYYGEHLPIHIYGPNGRTFHEMVNQICMDVGIALSYDLDGKVRFDLLRKPTGSIPIMPTAAIKGGLPTAKAILAGEKRVTEMHFSFQNRFRKFRNDPLIVTNAGASREMGTTSIEKVELETVTDLATASAVAERRAQETLGGNTAVTFSAGWEARFLRPGQALVVEGMPQVLRIHKKTPQALTGLTRIECLVDNYGATASDFVPSQGGGTENINLPAQNTADGVIEVPASLTAGQQAPQLMFPAIRADDTTMGQIVHLSPDGVSYTALANQGAIVSGGTLTEDLSAETASLLETGPVIEVTFLPDILEHPDLRGDLQSWRLGSRWAVIGDEICFVRNVVPVGGNFWLLEGLIRARYDTSKAFHATGSTVYLLGRDALPRVVDPGLIAPATTVYSKIQPWGDAGVLDLAEITEDTTEVFGKGYRPAKVGAPWSSFYRGSLNRFDDSLDMEIKWTYWSRLSPFTGAGAQPFGTPHTAATPEGQFRIEVKNSLGTIKRTTGVAGTNSWVYTAAQRNADMPNSANRDNFTITITNIENGHESPGAIGAFQRVF